MLNPHFNMLCLNVDAQINLEIVNYHIEFFLCLSKILLLEKYVPLLNSSTFQV